MPTEQMLTIEPVPAARRREALSLLLTGQPRGGEAAVEQFLVYASQEALSLDQFWLAHRSGQPLVAALIVPCAGRTGMVYLSPFDDPERSGVAAEVVRRACDAQDPQQMRIVQSLLDPDERLLARTYREAGLERLAVLIYMDRRVEQSPQPLELPEGMRVLHWKSRYRDLFAQGILGSYRDTRDCPGLLGLREIDDIIDGHMATGRFLPDLWHCVLQDEEPLAVMLLNLVPQRNAMELVYLGLSPEARGHGLAEKLLRHGLWLGHRHRAQNMLLAVDDQNVPAVRLYQRLGFQASCRKLAMIRAVSQDTG